MGGLPKVLEDNKARTLALPDKVKEILESKEISKDFDSDKFFRDEEHEYLDINLSNVDNLFKNIKQNVKEIDNFIDIGINDFINFLKEIIYGEINNSNKEKQYNEKFKNIKENLENRTKDTNAIRLYTIYLDQLKKNIIYP